MELDEESEVVFDLEKCVFRMNEDVVVQDTTKDAERVREF